jgi:pilus assembly protein FimV
MPHNMHLNSSNKFISTGLKTLTAAVVSTLLMVSSVEAAGLGKLTVLSSLGQPLRAEIELTSVSADEAGALVAKLASPETYQQANIDFNPALMSLQFAIDQRNGRRFVRVTSTQPINEPFVDMLMELGGTKARLVREYTLLLDPAGQRQAQPAQIAAAPHAATGALNAAPRSAPAQASQVQSQGGVASTITDATRAAAARAVAGGATAPASSASKPVASTSAAGSPAKSSSAAAAPASGDYQVKKGDSLARIASENLPTGISLDQMLVALYRSNEGAFVGKNMNRLRAGQILSIPDADSARSVSKSEARNIVLAQSNDFKSYRNKLAGMVESAAPNAAAESRQSSGGKITAKVEEQATPASESKDKLKLSRGAAADAKAADAKAADAKAAAAATAATEEKIAREKAAAEAQARVKELEKNVSDLQKTLELKNKNLADLQNQAANVKPATPAAAAPAAAVPVTPLPAATAPAAAVPAVAAVPVPAPAAAEPAAVSSAPAAIVDTGVASAAPVAAAAVAAAPTPAPAKPKVVAPPPPEPSFIESITENPLLLPVGGVLVALLAGLGLFRYRRNRARQQAFLDSSGAPMTNTGLKGNSLFGSTGGQSVDTKNSIFNSNFVPSVSHLDTNVDPVAEADVYIAYGRDAQAEEILKEALRNQPNRNAIRVKLLEIYANRKDPRSFEILASELYSLTRGEGEDWQQAAALGLNVDPANPLYGGGKLQDQVIAKANSITAPTQPMDGLDFNSLTAPTEPQAVAPIPELVHPAAPTQLLAPLTATELGKQGNAAAAPQAADMDFDLEELGSETSANQNTVLLSASHDAGKSMLDALDFELDHKPVAAPAAAPKAVEKSAAPAMAFSSLELPAGGQPSNYEPAHAHIDIPSETKPAKAPAAPSYAQHAEPMVAPLEFNLAGMNLDLDSAIHAHAPAASAAPAPAAVADVASSSAANPEMATKLDLAVAYKEIGDKEGARELLEEVLKGGSAEQVDAAKSLLTKL